jgi:hypothetical protein
VENYVQVVKMVVASAVNEQAEELYPRRWNAELIDMPVVNKQEQRRPGFIGDVVTAIVAADERKLFRLVRALCLGGIAIWRRWGSTSRTFPPIV